METLEQVMTERRGMFVRLALRSLSSIEEAEDCVQEAAVKALIHADQFRGDSAWSTWFGKIVLNCARMHNRKLSFHDFISTEEPLGENIVVADTLVDSKPLQDRQLEYTQMRHLLGTLNKSHRQVLKLRLEGMSFNDIAQHTGIPMGTAKARANRGRKELRNQLGI